MAPTTPISNPPRRLPLSLRLTVLFGGIMSGFGWIFFGFGMLFVFLLGSHGDYTSFFIMRGNLDTASAIVNSVTNTGFTVGGSRHSKGTPVYAFHYDFKINGVDYEGVSFQTGRTIKNPSTYTVTVEFPSGRPDCSRIRGMRRAPFGPEIGFVFLFPLIGLGLALSSLRRGWTNISLLANGRVAEGRLLNKEPTNTRVNNRPVYRLTFSFIDFDGQSRLVDAKTTTPEELDTGHLELVFYDPRNFKSAVLLDNLSGKPTLTDRGELNPCGLWSASKAIVAPFIALVIVAVGLWVKFAK